MRRHSSTFRCILHTVALLIIATAAISHCAVHLYHAKGFGAEWPRHVALLNGGLLQAAPIDSQRYEAWCCKCDAIAAVFLLMCVISDFLSSCCVARFEEKYVDDEALLIVIFLQLGCSSLRTTAIVG